MLPPLVLASEHTTSAQSNSVGKRLALRPSQPLTAPKRRRGATAVKVKEESTDEDDSDLECWGPWRPAATPRRRWMRSPRTRATPTWSVGAPATRGNTATKVTQEPDFGGNTGAQETKQEFEDEMGHEVGAGGRRTTVRRAAAFAKRRAMLAGSPVRHRSCRAEVHRPSRGGSCSASCHARGIPRPTQELQG